MKLYTLTSGEIEIPDIKGIVKYIDPIDIVTGLSRIVMFGGQTQRPYSLLEHSIRMADRCGSIYGKLYCMLHEAHRVYAKDLNASECADLQGEIYEYFGISYDPPRWWSDFHRESREFDLSYANDLYVGDNWHMENAIREWREFVSRESK